MRRSMICRQHPPRWVRKAELVRATGCPSDGEQPRARKGQAVSYSPLSPRCKFHLFVRQTYSPYTFASAGFQSLVAQATDQWHYYGGGTTGWSKRLGATLADTESRRFIQGFALSTILHQDPRYFPSPKHALLARAWYAATRVVVARCDDGHVTFNSAEFLGALFTSSLARERVLPKTRPQRWRHHEPFCWSAQLRCHR
jgi:hypothetical protein